MQLKFLFRIILPGFSVSTYVSYVYIVEWEWHFFNLPRAPPVHICRIHDKYRNTLELTSHTLTPLFSSLLSGYPGYPQGSFVIHVATSFPECSLSLTCFLFFFQCFIVLCMLSFCRHLMLWLLVGSWNDKDTNSRLFSISYYRSGSDYMRCSTARIAPSSTSIFCFSVLFPYPWRVYGNVKFLAISLSIP